MIDAIEKGMKLVHIDVRWNYTAAKAHKFFMIRPGTDYAFNLALINVILKEGLYDADFVERWVVGLNELQRFANPIHPHGPKRRQVSLPSRSKQSPMKLRMRSPR